MTVEKISRSISQKYVPNPVSNPLPLALRSDVLLTALQSPADKVLKIKSYCSNMQAEKLLQCPNI